MHSANETMSSNSYNYFKYKKLNGNTNQTLAGNEFLIDGIATEAHALTLKELTSAINFNPGQDNAVFNSTTSIDVKSNLESASELFNPSYTTYAVFNPIFNASNNVYRNLVGFFEYNTSKRNDITKINRNSDYTTNYGSGTNGTQKPPKTTTGIRIVITLDKDVYFDGDVWKIKEN